MKQLSTYINEDFKISKNTRCKEPTFYTMFGDIDINKFNENYQCEHTDEDVVKFASQMYQSTDVDYFMKKFFILTAEKQIEYYNSKNKYSSYSSLMKDYVKKAKKLNTWEEINYKCIPGIWDQFVYWLIDNRKKPVHEDFKISHKIKFEEPTFRSMFGNIDINQWNGTSNQYGIEDNDVIKFASNAYHSQEKNVYMKDFYMLTIKKLIEYYEQNPPNQNEDDLFERLKRYSNTAKLYNTWREIQYKCVTIHWVSFVKWLIYNCTVNEDFKISKNIKVDPSFTSIFGPDIDIFKWEYKGNQIGRDTINEIKPFAAKIYNSQDENVYMKKFYLVTFEKLIEYYKRFSKTQTIKRAKEYFKIAKTIDDWEELYGNCVTNHWLGFVKWLIDQREGNITEDFKISHKTKISIVPETFEDLFNVIYKRYNETSTYLDLRDIDVSKIKKFNQSQPFARPATGTDDNKWSGLFAYFDHVKTIDITGWYSPNVQNTRCMFWGCDELQEIKGLEGFCKNIKTMQPHNYARMFYKCDKLKKPSWYDDTN